MGFLSPIVIAFHAAFQSRNLLATVTATSLFIVVLTGILGRFLWSLVPSTRGKEIDLAEIQDRWQRHMEEIRGMVSEAHDPALVRSVLSWASASPEAHGGLIRHLLAMPLEHLRAREAARRLRPIFQDRAAHRAFARALHHTVGLRVQVGFYRSLRRLLSAWRAFHVVLAILMLFVIAAHIGVSLLLGYGWIFF